MSNELKPCPFCGGEVLEPLPRRWSNCLGDKSWSASVMCHACRLRIETDSIDYKTERDAIEAVTARWNTRTPEQAIAATLGRDSSADDALAILDEVRDADRIPYDDYSRLFDAIAVLGGEECVPYGEWERLSQTQEVRHMFCECGYELGTDERDSFPFKRTRLFAMPNYCQECGRKIRKAVER